MKEKFSFISYSDITSKLDREVQINDEILLLPKAPFSIDSYWQRWLGSIKCDEIAKSNLSILCKTYTERPEIMDHEHKQVQKKLLDFYYAFALYGTPSYSAANMLTGSINDENISIREVMYLDYFYVVYEGRPYTLRESDIPIITRLYESLSDIFSDNMIENEKYFRLRHGLTAFFKAIQTKENYYRIHQLVRSIESIIMPEKGKTTKQFTHKCKTFVKADSISETYLREIYDLRSKVEHLHPLLEVYPNLPKEEGIDKIDLRVRMVEEIARTAFKNILLNPELIKHFENNYLTDLFWKLPDKEREDIWGDKINLETVE